jgi:hypothetical protein
MTAADREALEYLLEHIRARAELTTAQADGRIEASWGICAARDRAASEALARVLGSE